MKKPSFHRLSYIFFQFFLDPGELDNQWKVKTGFSILLNRHQDYPLDYIYNENFDGNYGLLSSWFVSSGEIIKTSTDFFTYWSQINITLAIAVERYILIAKASQAESILNKSRRRKIYAFAIIWVAVPAIFSTIIKLNYRNSYDLVRMDINKSIFRLRE